MQILLSKSYEIYETEGLNIIKGEVKKIKKGKNLSIPHVGWSQIDILKNPIFRKFQTFQNFILTTQFFYRYKK